MKNLNVHILTVSRAGQLLWMSWLHFDHQRTLPVSAQATDPHYVRAQQGKSLGPRLLPTALPALQWSTHLLSPALATYSFPCRNTATRAVQPPTGPEASSSLPITSSWSKPRLVELPRHHFQSPYNGIPTSRPIASQLKKLGS